jgi:hypothetical protein
VLASDPVDLEQVERELRERLDALGPAPRAELLHVLMLPDSDLCSYPGTSPRSHGPDAKADSAQA